MIFFKKKYNPHVANWVRLLVVVSCVDKEFFHDKLLSLAYPCKQKMEYFFYYSDVVIQIVVSYLNV